MKKIITPRFRSALKSALLAAIALAFLLSANQSEAAVGDTFTDANFTYTVLTEEGTTGTVSVAKQSESTPSETVTIPSSVTNASRTYSVTDIGSYAFSYCVSLVSITIPDSVTNIGNYAFQGCSSLTNIEVSPWNMTYTAENGVLFTKDKTSLLNYPAGKEEEVYVIPENVTIINPSAFYNCSNLTRIVIPVGVTEINASKILNCNSLTDIEVSQENKNYTTIDGVLFTKNKTSLIIYPAGKKLETYTIPSSVTTIRFYAFDGCSRLANIVIPNNVTEIEMGAFRYCTSLTNIVIPDSITYIDWAVFEYCTSLTNVTIPDSVTKIDWSAFRNCENLIKITIPENVTEISDSAFSQTPLSKVYFKGDAPELGEEVFTSDPILYYIAGTAGWTTPTWNGYRTATWTPSEDPLLSFEVKGGKLILTYSGGKLEASGDLILWSPVEGAQEGEYEVDVSLNDRKFYRVVQ
ncbi:MAG: leucine-rich repeat domain-containing protein [Bacteroidales bacterium]|jgi:hypothetical protein|nr:leucine-rich repeat domain-containing protein [Bacteroidales bacterium]